MNSNTFSIQDSLKFGWGAFKKDPWFYVGATLSLGLFSLIVNWLTGQGHGLFSIVGFLIGLAATTVANIAYARLALSAEAGNHVGWEGLWAPENFWRMLGAMILQVVIIVVGFILLVIPGIIACLMLTFTQFLVVDKSLGPVEALKESYRLTKGHLFQLFLFALCLIALNIVGLVLLVVGLLVTVPVSLIAFAHVYRKVTNLQGVMVVPPVLPTPPVS